VLRKEMSAMQGLPEIQQRLASHSAEIVRMSPSEFGTFMAKELDKWSASVGFHPGRPGLAIQVAEPTLENAALRHQMIVLRRRAGRRVCLSVVFADARARGYDQQAS
jgi:hypothetical protein